MEIIPHGEEFCFIESVLELEPGVRASGTLVDVRDPKFAYLKAHFPQDQIIPGVILLEAIAQLGAFAVLSREENRGKNVVLGRVEGRLRKAIRPGEDVRLEVNIDRRGTKAGKGHGRALVGDEVRAEGTIIFAIADRKK